MPHLHPANYIAALLGIVSGPLLGMPWATVIGATISSVGIVLAAWVKKPRGDDGK